MAKLNKDKLLSLVSQEITNSLGFYGGDLSEHRRRGLKFYLGEPLGNEVEGQSQVVSQDLLETIETIMPSMMRIFTQGESIVRFEPQQPDDVEYADQATDYINHIFAKDNNGYQILHTMFKDALISKNGFVKFYWKTSKEQKKEKKISKEVKKNADGSATETHYDTSGEEMPAPEDMPPPTPPVDPAAAPGSQIAVGKKDVDDVEADPKAVPIKVSGQKEKLNLKPKITVKNDGSERK